MKATAVIVLIAFCTLAVAHGAASDAIQGTGGFTGRKMLQTSTAQAPATSQSSPSPSGPITQQQIQDQVNQDRQTGEQLQEQNEAKQYSAQAAGAPASEVAKMVDEGRNQQEQAQEQREANEYQMQQQYRDQQSSSSSTANSPAQG
ncbi:hypothetical protein COCSUDRAFT_63741 [Coccomyxa subellipsoidea C-169]|uniref:Uncharacterized protein n=1 Tax=Coccomyxa subellipsoidea (strain C-169) TaxID=574566 RepID=I0YW26_COCSC|nr:hypothetical protein COCSUDRAFT_63741 [Coccomyxa subellipsoidea C-169]EIE22595.1 hypothetical protein COCSUDRAFT_63741 [Coccomyxa subellipsoidea C-169]|eukprot:XP_005647139.1 hypothetical protein COCSUDRAFT_63741 [Coccomyxa subellipsoidea C-169]